MLQTSQLIAVLENPNFILNIGSVVRNINGLGIDQLLVVDGLNRLENNLEELRQRKSILKHSNGAIKWTEVKVLNTTIECFDYLDQLGFVSIGTTPHPLCKNQTLLRHADLTTPKLAIWFGNESSGLSSTAIEKCQSCVSIAMNGKVESLNLSTTTGIVLYEALRQRKTV
ncbi:MAG: hypothetical protein N4A35_03835 [Flavobacteriales bacterium]|jgi:tRNA (guanosine-2'-O-)-methyltransferase|nr:hypothetical protein [Flavobacteriales bacterium]